MMPYRVDARLSGRHPFEIYMLFFSFIVSLPILLGIDPPPGSIQEAFPVWASYLWGVSLTVGSGMALFGIYWRERATGLILEQLGLFLTGLGCLVYGAVLVWLAGQTGAFASAILLGFGLACMVRAFQIQQTLNDVHAAQVASEKERGQV